MGPIPKEPRTHEGVSSSVASPISVGLQPLAGVTRGKAAAHLRRPAPAGSAAKHFGSRIRQNAGCGGSRPAFWRTRLRRRARKAAPENASQRCPAGATELPSLTVTALCRPCRGWRSSHASRPHTSRRRLLLSPPLPAAPAPATACYRACAPFETRGEETARIPSLARHQDWCDLGHRLPRRRKNRLVLGIPRPGTVYGVKRERGQLSTQPPRRAAGNDHHRVPHRQLGERSGPPNIA